TPRPAASKKVRVEIHDPIRAKTEGSRKFREMPYEAVIQCRLPSCRDARQGGGAAAVHLMEDIPDPIDDRLGYGEWRRRHPRHFTAGSASDACFNVMTWHDDSRGGHRWWGSWRISHWGPCTL